MQISARVQPGATLGDGFQLALQSQFDGLGAPREKAIRSEVDRAASERRGRERATASLTRLDEFDAGRRLGGAGLSTCELPRLREPADAATHEDDGRTTHLVSRA